MSNRIPKKTLCTPQDDDLRTERNRRRRERQRHPVAFRAPRPSIARPRKGAKLVPWCSLINGRGDLLSPKRQALRDRARLRST